MSRISLEAFAAQRALSVFDTLRYVREHGISYERKDGHIFLDAIPPEARAPVVDWEKIKSFIVDAVDTLPKRHPEGLHTVYSGFNHKFRQVFPDLDPIQVTEQLAQEGFLRIPRAKGGRLIFLNTRDPLHPAYDPVGAVVSPVLSPYDYPTKKLWRGEWYSFLAKHVIPSEDTRVLTLGGFGGEIPGYEALGIQRKNIVVVEREWERARYIAAHYPGVAIRRSELADVLATETEPFDAVLLDYDGNLSNEKVTELDTVLARELLKKQAALGINLFAKREHDDIQALYLEPYIEDALPSLRGTGIERDRIPPDVIDHWETLNPVRDYGMTALLFRFCMGKNVREINRALLETLSRKEAQRLEQLIARHPPKNFMEYLRMNDLVRATMQTTCTDAGISPLLAFITDCFHSKPYFVRAVHRLKYRTAGNNNTFYSDFVALDTERDVVERVFQDSFFNRFLYGKETVTNLAQRWASSHPSRKTDMNRFIERCGSAVRQRYINFFITEQTPQREFVGQEAAFGAEYVMTG